jgi:diguanylate cyclase (GGDEF)-like protein
MDAKKSVTTDTYKFRNPYFTIKLFIGFSIVSAVIILSLINIGIYKLFEQHNLSEAQRDAVNVSAALFEQEKELLLHKTPEGTLRLSIAKENVELLDQRMRNYLHLFEIVKIKVFSTQGHIIYSTDHSIIGKSDTDNPDLLTALNGQVTSKFKTRDKIWDLVGEQRYDVDIVESYVPIIANNNIIVGSFEVYLDITSYRTQIKEFIKSTLHVTVVIMIIVLGFLFSLMLFGANQLREAHNRLNELATTDGLTKLFNRKYVLYRAEEEFHKVKRLLESDKQGTLGFIMLDVDHFKQINDSLGHQAGDEVLRQLGQRIQEHTRKYDLTGRYGGEEFIIISHAPDDENIQALAERIWQDIRDKPFTFDHTHTDVTASLGISCLKTEDKSIESAIKRADDALYQAKIDGRDKIVWIR